MGSRYLKIENASGSHKVDPEDIVRKAETMPSDCRTLFVRNLPYEFKEDDIGDRFRPFGEIQEVRVPRNWQTKQSKGFAFVVFKDHDSAKAALLKLNGKALKNYGDRVMKIDFDTKQKPKSSFKVNLEDEGNVRFNKQIKKEEKSKIHRKEALKKKIKKFGNV